LATVAIPGISPAVNGSLMRPQSRASSARGDVDNRRADEHAVPEPVDAAGSARGAPPARARGTRDVGFKACGALERTGFAVGETLERGRGDPSSCVTLAVDSGTRRARGRSSAREMAGFCPGPRI
jgi:hypothetical protein